MNLEIVKWVDIWSGAVYFWVYSILDIDVSLILFWKYIFTITVENVAESTIRINSETLDSEKMNEIIWKMLIASWKIHIDTRLRVLCHFSITFYKDLSTCKAKSMWLQRNLKCAFFINIIIGTKEKS